MKPPMRLNVNIAVLQLLDHIQCVQKRQKTRYKIIHYVGVLCYVTKCTSGFSKDEHCRCQASSLQIPTVLDGQTLAVRSLLTERTSRTINGRVENHENRRYLSVGYLIARCQYAWDFGGPMFLNEGSHSLSFHLLYSVLSVFIGPTFYSF